jgi:hypothetical protein
MLSVIITRNTNDIKGMLSNRPAPSCLPLALRRSRLSQPAPAAPAHHACSRSRPSTNCPANALHRRRPPSRRPAAGHFCPVCGAPVQPGSHFCPECGKKLD